MARLFTAASSEYITCPDRAAFDTTSGTVCGWFKTSSSGADRNIMRRDLGSGTLGTTRQWLLRVSSANKVAGFLLTAGVPGVTSAATKNDGAWHHAAFTWSWNGSTTTIELFVDGASEGTNSDGNALVGSTEVVCIGAQFDGVNPFECMDGDLAECAMWNAALTAAEVSALAKGYAPGMVRPASLILDVPMIREVIDRRGATPTAVGTTVSTHPRIIYPRRARTHEYTAAAAGSTIGLLRANAGLNYGPFSLANAGVGAIA